MDAFDLAVMETVEQGSEAWHLLRLGRFTSSEMYKLLTKPGERPMTAEELQNRPASGKGSRTTTVKDFSILSEGAITYVEQKVGEVLTGRQEEDVYAYAKEYGKEMEPVAAQYFSEKSRLTLIPAPFVPFGIHAGGSPDRFVIEENAGVEIKCPLKSSKQVKYLQLNDQMDLLENFPDHYWQCMSNLLFTEREKWYFVTFHPGMKNENHKMKVIEVKPLADHFIFITQAINAAVEKKLQLLQELN